MARTTDPDAQRRQLLQDSLGSFARQGYGKVTMRGLARELGVSTGSLYHYFEGKDRLFQEMFEFVAQQDVRDATESLRAEMPLREQLASLRDFVQRRREHLQSVLLVALDFARQHPEPEARAFLARTTAFYREALEDRLGPSAQPLAPVILSAIMGTLVHGVLAPASVDVSTHFAALEALLPG